MATKTPGAYQAPGAHLHKSLRSNWPAAYGRAAIRLHLNAACYIFLFEAFNDVTF